MSSWPSFSSHPPSAYRSKGRGRGSKGFRKGFRAYAAEAEDDGAGDEEDLTVEEIEDEDDREVDEPQSGSWRAVG